MARAPSPAREARALPRQDTASTRRGGNEAAELQLAVGTEVLDERAGVAVAFLSSGSAAVWLVNVREGRAEAPDGCWLETIGAGDEEDTVGNVASYRSEQPRRAE